MQDRRGRWTRTVTEPQGNGWLIQCARARAGLSQPALAVAAGIGDGAAVSRIENGAARVGPSRLAKIAAVLGLTPAELSADAGQRLKLAVQRSRWIAAGRPDLRVWLGLEGL